MNNEIKYGTWILVKDALPEMKEHDDEDCVEPYYFSDYVLLYVNSSLSLHNTNISMGFYEKDFGWVDMEGASFKDNEVIAWMPLPELPKLSIEN